MQRAKSPFVQTAILVVDILIKHWSKPYLVRIQCLYYCDKISIEAVEYDCIMRNDDHRNQPIFSMKNKVRKHVLIITLSWHDHIGHLVPGTWYITCSSWEVAQHTIHDFHVAFHRARGDWACETQQKCVTYYIRGTRVKSAMSWALASPRGWQVSRSNTFEYGRRADHIDVSVAASIGKI